MGEAVAMVNEAARRVEEWAQGYLELCARVIRLEIANVGCGVSFPYIRRGGIRRLFFVGMRRWWVGWSETWCSRMQDPAPAKRVARSNR